STRPPTPLSTLFPYTTLFRSYAGRWFPVSRYGINRFTARINVAVPAGYTVIGSGKAAGGNFASGLEENTGEEETPALRRKGAARSEEHTSELQSPYDLVCRLL